MALPTVKELEQAIEVVKLLELIDPYNFVEPCEENCSPVRHARHQGQWEMAGRMQEAIDKGLMK